MKCKICKAKSQKEYCDKCMEEINDRRNTIKFQKETLVKMGIKVDCHNSSEFCKEPKICRIIFNRGKINNI